MAVKTITIDLEAYERLKGVKRGNESFSETLKRIVPRQIDPDAFLAKLQGRSLSVKTARAIEETVERRANRGRRR